MTYNKQYHVMYKPGFVGTWLAWFINQHKDFPNYKMELNYGDRHDSSIPTDFVCKGGSWFEGSGQSFTQSMTSEKERKSIMNERATLRCYKTFPHDYSNDSDDVDRFVQTVSDTMDEYNVIIPIVQDMYHAKILARRFVNIVELSLDRIALS